MNIESTDESVIIMYQTHMAAEHAVRTLQGAGFDMKKLSIVGRDYRSEEHITGYYNLGDRMAAWGSMGAFWGGIWGLLLGAAFFWVPGVGPVVLAGPIVAALVGGLEGALVVGGLSALGAALFNIGIPKDEVLRYETELKAGKFMVVYHGPEEEVARARQLLGSGDVYPPRNEPRREHIPSSSVLAEV